MNQEDLYAALQAIIIRNDPSYMSHSGAFIEHLKNLAGRSDLAGFANSCALYLKAYPRDRNFLYQRIPGILYNNYFNTLSDTDYHKFIQWTIDTPSWADNIKKYFWIPERLVATAESIKSSISNMPTKPNIRK